MSFMSWPFPFSLYAKSYIKFLKDWNHEACTVYLVYQIWLCFFGFQLLMQSNIDCTQGTNNSQQCNKSYVPLLKSRITERITPKHKHFPTNTYQYKFKPTHTNAKILPTPTKIHQNYGIFTLIPTHLMTNSPPPTYLANQKKYQVK